jgi:hypothetical protein
MTTAIHPEATHHLPFFITPPGETDILMNVMMVFLALMVFLIGILYLRLHALPEHMAHSTQKVQYEIVAVLALISLFTHNHLYWIIGLLLALVQIPDFSTPLSRMADSLAKMAGAKRTPRTAETAHASLATSRPASAVAARGKGPQPCLSYSCVRWSPYCPTTCSAAMHREGGSATRSRSIPYGLSSVGVLPRV